MLAHSTAYAADPRHSAGPSPLQLADRMITLAQEADRSGHADAAAGLLTLMYAVLDGPHH